MSRTKVEELITLIDRLDSLACWDDAEYREAFGVSKSITSADIRMEIRQILDEERRK